MAYQIAKNLTKSQRLVDRDHQVVAPCQRLSYYPLVVERGKGELLQDADGNEYIDFLSSASSLNLGSSHPVITAAIQAQLQKCTQYTSVYTYNEPMIRYAEKLTSVFPGKGKAKIVFGNCGSDGNDAAIKFSRAYTGRSKIITFINGYHGNTYGASSLSSCTFKMREKIGPFLPDIYHFPFYGVDASDEVVQQEGIRQIKDAFSTYLPAKEVAAFIIEPIQGDGGMLPAHPLFMKQLYEVCQTYGILFISEEVQQGFWRTGRFWGIENYPDVIPDGIIMGKSVGAGLTLGAFMARAEIMDSLPAPAHIFTLAGNALACAAGNAAFDVYESEAFQNQLRANSQKLQELMQWLKEQHPKTVGFYRGIGMSYGIGIVKTDDKGHLIADPQGAFKVCFRSFELGLVVITLGGHILRIQPPLNISTAHLEKAFEILHQALAELEEGRLSDDVLSYQFGW